MLLGTGLVGGIMRNNGRYTATEEAITLGFRDLFELIDQHCRHKNIVFPGHKHASLYDVGMIEPAVKNYLADLGVEMRLQCRISEVEMQGCRINRVIDDDDAFVDTTGTAGDMAKCRKLAMGVPCVFCAVQPLVQELA